MIHRRIHFRLARLLFLVQVVSIGGQAWGQAAASLGSETGDTFFAAPPAQPQAAESVLADSDGKPGAVHEEDEGFFVWDDDYSNRCCGDCPPGWTGRFDFMSLRRERSSQITLSHAFALDSLDYEPGGRVTLIRHRDCLDAWEFTYAGQFDWSESGSVTGVGLGSRLASTTINLSEFNNASFHGQAYRSRLDSFEANRRWFGWDVISTMVGFRYIRLDERYDFNTVGPLSTGQLSVRTSNDLFGVQIGMDLNYPVGRFYSTTVMKAGLYLNSADSSARLVNAGVTQFSNSADDLDIAGMFELGYFLGFNVTRNLRMRAGYELWWITEIALVPDQIQNPLTVATGSQINNGGYAFYHGFSAGVEMTW